MGVGGGGGKVGEGSSAQAVTGKVYQPGWPEAVIRVKNVASCAGMVKTES